MKNKKHILIISQYFYPENFRVNDLAKEWVKRGYKVTVVTGIPNYPKGSFYDGFGVFKKRKEAYHGIDVVRLPIIPRKNNKIMLALNYVSFVISGYVWSLFTRLKPDYVFTYEVSPMTQALPAIRFAKKRKIPCYLYVTDLWPESLEVVLGLQNKLALKVLNKMVDYIYKSSDKILTSSQSFVTKISSRDVDYAKKLMFWPQYAEEFYCKENSRNIDIYDRYFKGDDSFKILFAGNVGKAQGLGILVDVAKYLKKDGLNVKFYIVGDGRDKQNLLDMIVSADVQSYFVFIDTQAPQMIKHFMYESNASLICLTKSEIFSMTIPGKTQSCLACGLPILVSADGEVQNIVKNANAGLCGDAEDDLMLYNNIIELVSYDKSKLDELSRNSLKCSKDFFDKDKLMDEIDVLFK